MSADPYEGSWRQRRHKRRVRIMALVLSLALLLPIIFATIDAVIS